MCEECGMHGHEKLQPILAVCGKGGVGKTVFSALLSRVLIEQGRSPLLLIDADPVGGLTSAIGERAVDTLAGVKDRFINEARKGDKTNLAQAADKLDYFVLKALVERKGYALLAMGHNEGKGCFCPANNLLKSAIDMLIPGFAGVLIDAEAGIEQINRDVTGRVTRIITVVDGSQRSMDTLKMITEKFGTRDVMAVVNRAPEGSNLNFPPGIQPIGYLPEDEELMRFDREGKPLWLLPEDNKVLAAMRVISGAILTD